MHEVVVGAVLREVFLQQVHEHDDGHGLADLVEVGSGALPAVHGVGYVVGEGFDAIVLVLTELAVTGFDEGILVARGGWGEGIFVGLGGTYLVDADCLVF